MENTEVKVEPFEWKRHYLRLAPIVARYFIEVNGENMEEETPVLIDGRWIGVKKLDAKMQALLYEGIFVKVAIVDGDIVGFIWYKDLFRSHILGIEAFWVAKAFRKTKVGQKLINSFTNEFNQGKFRIIASYHAQNPPEEMLAAFHEWKELGPMNDRDLVLIEGIWDLRAQKKDEEQVIYPRKLG